MTITRAQRQTKRQRRVSVEGGGSNKASSRADTRTGKETGGHGDRQPGRQTGMHTDRDGDRQTERHAYRQTSRQPGRQGDRQKEDSQTERPGGGLMNTVIRPGAGLMNTVINYDSGKPSDPLRGYSYAHDSNFDRPAKSWSRCTK